MIIEICNIVVFYCCICFIKMILVMIRNWIIEVYIWIVMGINIICRFYLEKNDLFCMILGCGWFVYCIYLEKNDLLDLFGYMLILKLNRNYILVCLVYGFLIRY